MTSKRNPTPPVPPVGLAGEADNNMGEAERAPNPNNNPPANQPPIEKWKNEIWWPRRKSKPGTGRGEKATKETAPESLPGRASASTTTVKQNPRVQE